MPILQRVLLVLLTVALSSMLISAEEDVKPPMTSLWIELDFDGLKVEEQEEIKKFLTGREAFAAVAKEINVISATSDMSKCSNYLSVGISIGEEGVNIAFLLAHRHDAGSVTVRKVAFAERGSMNLSLSNEGTGAAPGKRIPAIIRHLKLFVENAAPRS